VNAVAALTVPRAQTRIAVANQLVNRVWQLTISEFDRFRSRSPLRLVILLREPICG
jgi:hypothetical protein